MSLRDLLRPPPHRGPLIAAGGVSLAVGITLTVLRLQATLPIGVDAALLLVPGALLFFLGAQAPNEQGEPPAYQSVLLCTGLPLLYEEFPGGHHVDPPYTSEKLWHALQEVAR